MKTTIKIKRPSGEIEILDVSEKFPMGLTDGMFSQIAAATKAAGRGDVLSYNVEKDQLTEEEIKKINEQKARSAWFKKHGFTSGNF